MLIDNSFIHTRLRANMTLMNLSNGSLDNLLLARAAERCPRLFCQPRTESAERCGRIIVCTGG